MRVLLFQGEYDIIVSEPYANTLPVRIRNYALDATGVDIEIKFNIEELYELQRWIKDSLEEMEAG